MNPFLKPTFLLLWPLLASVVNLFGQSEKKYIREGNKQFETGKYNEAEKNYRKSLEKKPGGIRGQFNLGDAYYKQNKFQEASSQFDQLLSKTSNADTLAQIYHNMGNSLLKEKKYEEAVKSYKNGLKLNPDDEETRYNLAYAQQMLRQIPPPPPKQNKDDKDKKDDKKKDEKKQDKQEDNKNEQQKKEQPKPDQISKEDAKRLLEALNNDEKKTQEKLKLQRAKGAKNDIEKDW